MFMHRCINGKVIFYVSFMLYVKLEKLKNLKKYNRSSCSFYPAYDKIVSDTEIVRKKAGGGQRWRKV